MTVQVVPAYLQNASHAAALFRQVVSAPWATGGIVTAGELAVTAQSTPNMSVQIAAGRAIVPGTNVSPPAGFAFTTQGNYFLLNDATISVTVSPSNPTNPRIDVVYAGVQDSFYAGGTNTALIGIVAGVPAPTPVAPAVPTNAIAIATIAVAANATSIVSANIANIAGIASLQPNLAPSKAARNAMFPTPLLGDSVFRTDKGRYETYFDTTVKPTAGWYQVGGAPSTFTPTLFNSWIAYGGTYNMPVATVNNGIVLVEIMIKGGATGAGTKLANIPAGGRPTGPVNLMLMNSVSTYQTAQITAAGDVFGYNPDAVYTYLLCTYRAAEVPVVD